MAVSEMHECVFVEEQEPSGRLILPPCIVCGFTAMDSADQLREERSMLVAALGEVFEFIKAELDPEPWPEIGGYLGWSEERQDALREVMDRG